MQKKSMEDNFINVNGLHLLLLRQIGTKGFSKGFLFTNGDFQCYTLEDEFRDVKIYGETAIPEGTYNIVNVYSPSFKRVLPKLVNVPGYTDILMHSGNTVLHTKGCILVGNTQDKAWLGKSIDALNALLPKINEGLKSIHPVTITIKNIK